MLNSKILNAYGTCRLSLKVRIGSKNFNYLDFYFSGCWGIQESAEGKWKIAGMAFDMKISVLFVNLVDMYIIYTICMIV